MAESTTPDSGRPGEPVLPTRRSLREARVLRETAALMYGTTETSAQAPAPELTAPAARVAAPLEHSSASAIDAAPVFPIAETTAASIAPAPAAPLSTPATPATEALADPLAAPIAGPAETITMPAAASLRDSIAAEPVGATRPIDAPMPAATHIPAAPSSSAPGTPGFASATASVDAPLSTSGARRDRTRTAPSRPGTRPSSPKATAQPRRRRSLGRTLFAALIVPALFGTAALPAFAEAQQASAMGGDTYYSASQLLRGDAQTVTVSAQADADLVSRDGYSASNSGASTISGTALQGYSAPSDMGWWRPVDGPITSPYGPRNLICNGVGCSNGFHEGIDFGNACGTPIKATAAGRVTFVGNAGAYGNRVIIDHGAGVSTVYGHIQAGTFEVAVGDEIEGGVVIASVGATGVVSGCHLDLKVELDGEMTDPAAYLTMMGVPKVIFGS